MIVNLDGRALLATAERLGDGPLFAVQPTAAQDRFAEQFALRSSSGLAPNRRWRSAVKL